MDNNKKRPPREAVLIVLHADNFVEVFGKKNVNVRIVRCPASFSDGMAIVAEDVVERMLPHYWRKLYFPANVRATANARPLFPSVMAGAKQAETDIAVLNKLGAAI